VTREKVYVLVVLPDLRRDVISGATNALPHSRGIPALFPREEAFPSIYFGAHFPGAAKSPSTPYPLSRGTPRRT
jgi:hypothetical protein